LHFSMKKSQTWRRKEDRKAEQPRAPGIGRVSPCKPKTESSNGKKKQGFWVGKGDSYVRIKGKFARRCRTLKNEKGKNLRAAQYKKKKKNYTRKQPAVLRRQKVRWGGGGKAPESGNSLAASAKTEAHQATKSSFTGKEKKPGAKKPRGGVWGGGGGGTSVKRPETRWRNPEQRRVQEKKRKLGNAKDREG